MGNDGEYIELRNSLHKLREQMQPYVVRTERLAVELEYMKNTIAEQTQMLKKIDSNTNALTEARIRQEGELERMKSEQLAQTNVLTSINTNVTTLNEAKAYSKGAIAVWAFIAAFAAALLSGGVWEMIRVIQQHH